jgi:hypothetical protein
MSSGLAPGDVVELLVDDDDLRGERVTIDKVDMHGGVEFVTFLHPRADDDDWKGGDPWLTLTADQVRPVRAS